MSKIDVKETTQIENGNAGAEGADQQPILKPEDGSWPSKFVNALAEKFLSTRRAEFEDFEAREMQKARAASRFGDFTNGIEERKQKLAILREKILFYKSGEIGKSIFQNWRATGQPIETIASNGLLVVSLMLKQVGDDVLRAAEAEFAAYEKEFAAFKADEKTTLHELGLI